MSKAWLKIMSDCVSVGVRMCVRVCSYLHRLPRWCPRTGGRRTRSSCRGCGCPPAGGRYTVHTGTDLQKATHISSQPSTVSESCVWLPQWSAGVISILTVNNGQRLIFFFFFPKLILACQRPPWPPGEILYVNHSLEPTLAQANTPTFTSRCCDATSISRHLGGTRPVSALANGETHYGNIIYSDLWPKVRRIPAHWSFQRAARGCMN